MGAILDMMQNIRERPGIILGRPSANTLHAFLSGFAYARKDSDGISSTQGWAKIIEFYSMNEADEMALFWKLMDEYLAQRRSGRKKVS